MINNKKKVLITGAGEGQSIRLAISRDDVVHTYPDGDHKND